jgi:hypothetical protein
LQKFLGFSVANLGKQIVAGLVAATAGAKQQQAGQQANADKVKGQHSNHKGLDWYVPVRRDSPQRLWIEPVNRKKCSVGVGQSITGTPAAYPCRSCPVQRGCDLLILFSRSKSKIAAFGSAY